MENSEYKGDQKKKALTQIWGKNSEKYLGKFGKILKIRKNTENSEKCSEKFGKILQKIRKILWKIRKNAFQNQDPGRKITFSDYG